MDGAFVVKNGSNTFACVCSSIPWPVSWTSSETYGPGDAAARRLLVRRADIDVPGRERQTSAGGHRIARVDDQVHDHLLQLCVVGNHARLAVDERDGQVDVLANQTPEHPLHVGDEGVQVEHAGGRLGAAAEREQLSA